MGGLITSTLVTLIVLPTLYALFANRFDPIAKHVEI
jgi:Cu/Ag efflux pump CusA